MASDSSSGCFSFPTWGITYFFTDTRNTTERVEEKNKWTNTDLGQLQAQEREFVKLCILWANVSEYSNEILTSH